MWQKMSAVLGRARLAVLGAALGVASCGFPDYAGFAPPEVDSGSPAKDGAAPTSGLPLVATGRKRRLKLRRRLRGQARAQPSGGQSVLQEGRLPGGGMYQRRVRHAGMHGPRQERRRDRRRLRRKLSHHLRLGQNVRHQLLLRRRAVREDTVSRLPAWRRGQERGRGGHRLRVCKACAVGKGVRRRKRLCDGGLLQHSGGAQRRRGDGSGIPLAEGAPKARTRDFPRPVSPPSAMTGEERPGDRPGLRGKDCAPCRADSACTVAPTASP